MITLLAILFMLIYAPIHVAIIYWSDVCNDKNDVE